MPLAFFFVNREYVGIMEVAEIQQTSVAPILYGSVLGRSDPFLYKSHLVDLTKPSVVVLGGSTVLQARQRMFLETMINAGQSMDSVLEGLQFAPVLISNKPAIVIIGIQPWWFTVRARNKLKVVDGVVQLPARKRSNLSAVRLHPDIDSSSASEQISLWDSVKFYRWWIQDKIDSKMIYDLFGGHKNEHIGVSARYRKDGNGPDGSWYYTSRVTGLEPLSKGDQIEEDINRGWLLNSALNETALDNFLSLIKELQRADIQTIVYFIPFPPALVDLMDASSEKFDWITILKHKLRDRGLELFDYSFHSEISVDDCEFLDGLHGGEITFMRVLKQLSKDTRKIRKYIDEGYLDASISQYSGNAFVPNAAITINKEVDFGSRGCVKK